MRKRESERLKKAITVKLLAHNKLSNKHYGDYNNSFDDIRYSLAQDNRVNNWSLVLISFLLTLTDDEFEYVKGIGETFVRDNYYYSYLLELLRLGKKNLYIKLIVE